MSRLDGLRSLMRDAAVRASKGLEKLAGLSEARRVLRELAHQRLLVPDALLTSAVARAHGAESAAARSRDGALWVDVYFSDGEHLEVCFTPGRPTFAPRGAKEIEWIVGPPEALRSRHLADVASALSSAVAHVLWAVAIPRGGADVGAGAIVDRDGPDRLRVDLRTVPAVRDRMSQGAAAIVEVLELESIECGEGELRLQLRLPRIV